MAVLVGSTSITQIVHNLNKYLFLSPMINDTSKRKTGRE